MFSIEDDWAVDRLDTKTRTSQRSEMELKLSENNNPIPINNQISAGETYVSSSLLTTYLDISINFVTCYKFYNSYFTEFI